MKLWIEWFKCVQHLRPACSRFRTFLWMTLVLAGFAVRPEIAGVTSFVRALWLRAGAYDGLLNFFHSPSLAIDKLTGLWAKLVQKIFSPLVVNGRLVCVADGIKVAKEGLKMPAVKKLFQSSGDNSKPAYIFGHSFQALGLLVQGPLGHIVSVPLASRIHEGIQNAPSPKSRKKTLLDKLVELLLAVAGHLPRKVYLLADAYYASRKIIVPLLAEGHHLITRAKRNVVAYHQAPTPKKRKRGRPKKYGEKVALRHLLSQTQDFQTAPSPVYGEHGVEIQYLVIDLLWRPVGRLVRFVLVKHPTRGTIILMCTDLELDPIKIVELYGYRFKIEASFKQAVHTIGAFAYHFWMKGMVRISHKRSGDQYLHRRSEHYRRLVLRKMDAYHRFVQLACIAQGLQQYLALYLRTNVWRHFRSWLRTMNPLQPPSEAVVAQALRNTLPEFLLGTSKTNSFAKFLMDHLDPERCPDLHLAA